MAGRMRRLRRVPGSVTADPRGVKQTSGAGSLCCCTVSLGGASAFCVDRLTAPVILSYSRLAAGPSWQWNKSHRCIRWAKTCCRTARKSTSIPPEARAQPRSNAAPAQNSAGNSDAPAAPAPEFCEFIALLCCTTLLPSVRFQHPCAPRGFTQVEASGRICHSCLHARSDQACSDLSPPVNLTARP
jgi:hypothetical protein